MEEQLGPVTTAKDLKSRGFQPRSLARLVKAGQIDRVRRGVYADPLGDQNMLVAHQRLVMATMRQLGRDACVSHTSAAVVHGFPVPPALDQVHVTRARQSGQGRRSDNVHVHTAPLPDGDIELINQLMVTSVPRTIVDSARILSTARGVAMADYAIRLELTDLEALTTISDALGRRVGVGKARTVMALVDGRSESPGESLSRIKFIQSGFPLPDLQRELYTDDGMFVARVDFIWDDYNLVGEFDGKMKYGRDLRPGVPIEQIVYEEKLREDAIRELGRGVVRWTWSDIFTGNILTKVDRALTRAAR